MYRRLGEGETPAPVAPVPTSDFLNITGGISSILAPLAQVGVSLYQTKQLQKLEKARMKAEAASQNAMAMMAPPPPVVVQSGSGALIGVIIGGVAMMGILVFVLTRKKGGGSTETGYASTSSSSVATTRIEAAPAPRIKRIKRVSRPRHAY